MTLFLEYDSNIEAAQAALRLAAERPKARVTYRAAIPSLGLKALVVVSE